MARVTFEDEATATNASFEEEIAMAEATTNEDTVSMDELEAAEATFDDVPTTFAGKT